MLLPIQTTALSKIEWLTDCNTKLPTTLPREVIFQTQHRLLQALEL